MEGFICPICYQDLKTTVSLSNHFQNHSQHEKNILESVKDIYEKAKKKITNKRDVARSQNDDESPVTDSRGLPGYPPSSVQDFDAVSIRSHTARFKAIRDIRNERYAAQTNTLLIRLAKLLIQLPSDPVRRKAYEQEIVPWLDDKDVPLCPSCAKPFNLLKRKHHCRLCGSIMCKNCTFLLPLDSARKMVGSSELALPSPLKKIQPVQAVQAVLSLDNVIDGDFRVCEHCHRLLTTREMIKSHRNDRPIIAQFYERLCTALTACDKAVDEYLTIYNSLCAGKSTYSLDDGKVLRIELLRMADSIDSTSKKIAVLGQNTDSPPQGAALKLQQSIRSNATLFLKRRVLSLPSLPTDEQIAEYAEQRRLAIERRIEDDRRKEMEEERKRLQDERLTTPVANRPSPVPSARAEQVAVEEGWTPSVKQAIISDDPLLQQIGILHGFIEQAQRAGKMDECEALQRNLMELEEALDRREAEN